MLKLRQILTETVVHFRFFLHKIFVVFVRIDIRLLLDIVPLP